MSGSCSARVPLGKPLNERRRLRHLRDGIENHLGGQTSGKVVREISVVVDIGGIRPPRALVGRRRENDLAQMLDVIPVLDKVFNERIHQGLIGGWVGRTDVVYGISQSSAHKVCPDSVDDGARERLVRGRSQPLGQDLTPSPEGTRGEFPGRPAAQEAVAC